MEQASFFAAAPQVPADAIFALTAEYVRDESPLKVNLGQGTYRNGNGKPWVLNSVAACREQLAQDGLLHEYLPITGLPEFRSAASELVLGSEIYQQKRQQIATCQSISGTGSLHLAGFFLKRFGATTNDVYIPDPSWSNHNQLFTSLGFDCHLFNYYDAKRRRIDMDSYIHTLKSIQPGSIVILHACAHNPTGFDPSQEQWRVIGQIVKERKLFPVFDAAYLGFNSGNVDQDAYAIRYFVHELGLEAAICMSFAKNMGLYGERVGCVVIATNSDAVAQRSQSVLESLQRSEISNPPAYGAKIAAKILNDQQLRKLWFNDLLIMSGRIRDMRQKLFDGLNAEGAEGNWDHLIRQSGMFGFLGLSRDVVHQLKVNYHIYMAENSRVSIAGLNDSNVAYVAKSIAEVLRQSKARPETRASL